MIKDIIIGVAVCLIVSALNMLKDKLKDKLKELKEYIMIKLKEWFKKD